MLPRQVPGSIFYISASNSASILSSEYSTSALYSLHSAI